MSGTLASVYIYLKRVKVLTIEKKVKKVVDSLSTQCYYILMRYINSNCTYTQNYDEGTYTFTGPCRVTGESYTVTIPGAELFDLNQGLPIQDALCSLDAEQREFVMSGTSPKGWAKLFGEKP